MTAESLLPLPAENFGSLHPFLPDVPWTTQTLHVLQQHRGQAYVDGDENPRNIVVTALGKGDANCPDVAYLFGKPEADGIRTYVAGVSRITEFVCDEDMVPAIQELQPSATARKTIVVWYDYLDVELLPPRVDGMRRLRSADAEHVEALLGDEAFRTFADGKAVVMSGAAYGVFHHGELVSMAYIADNSMKFERITAFTLPEFRRKGFAYACCAKLLDGSSDRGRLVCAFVPETAREGYALAGKLGFPQRALMTSWVTQ